MTGIETVSPSYRVTYFSPARVRRQRLIVANGAAVAAVATVATAVAAVVTTARHLVASLRSASRKARNRARKS